MIIKDIDEYLISYANLKFGLFKNCKNFCNEDLLIEYYKKKNLGIPQCLPINIKYFNYRKAKFFKIDKQKFIKNIFNTNKKNYIGVKKFFRYGNKFAYNVSLKKKYLNRFNFFYKNLIFTRNQINKINKKYKNNVCSMQLRNVPHYGHEAIFKFLIKKFDFLVLNPIFGIKKKNDFSDDFISKSLKFMEKKYCNKLKFLPIWTNFYYAGPREALHHLNIRENLGFKNFYIGRDHAGAENIYKKDAAKKLAKRFKNKYKINIASSDGGYFCKSCNKYLIKNTCRHNHLLNISGTQFRKSINKQVLFKHADPNMQKKIVLK